MTSSKKAIKPSVLVGIILLQAAFSYHVGAQNLTINVGNPPHPNLGNFINVINNGPGQLALIDNGPNNNSQPSQSFNVAVIKKKTPSPVKKAKVTPIHKPQTKVITKPINKQVSVNYKPKPIVKPKKQLPLPQKKASVTTAPVNKPVLIVQQPINKPIVNELSNVSVNPTQRVIIENTVVAALPVQTSNQLIVKPNEEKVYASSGSSGSSKKATNHFYASKRKTINHFRCSTNKKIAKLFARNKKMKIDPAKCFAWS